MQRLDAATRNIAIGRLKAVESQNAVARHYNVQRNDISSMKTIPAAGYHTRQTPFRPPTCHNCNPRSPYPVAPPEE